MIVRNWPCENTANSYMREGNKANFVHMSTFFGKNKKRLFVTLILALTRPGRNPYIGLPGLSRYWTFPFLSAASEPQSFAHLPETPQSPLVSLSLPRPDVVYERTRVLAAKNRRWETGEVETEHLVDGIVSQVDVSVVSVLCLVGVGLRSKPDRNWLSCYWWLQR